MDGIDWQPIETAPKNGERVLVYFELETPFGGWNRVQCGYWDGARGWYGDRMVLTGMRGLRATHWAKLSTPEQAAMAESISQEETPKWVITTCDMTRCYSKNPREGGYIFAPVFEMRANPMIRPVYFESQKEAEKRVRDALGPFVRVISLARFLEKNG